MISLSLALGLLGGAGIFLLVSTVPMLQRNVAKRVAPYVSDVSQSAFNMSRSARERDWVRQAFRTLSRHLTKRFTDSGGGLTTLARQAAIPGGVDQVRISAFVFGTIGAAAGLLLATFSAGSFAGYVLLPTVFAATGAAVPVLNVRARARKRVERIEREMPTVLEFLALCVSAGEGLPDAFARVAKRGAGELPAEFAEVVRQASLGRTFADALQGLATDLGIPALNRLVVQLLSALDRGSPLSEVLRAQAADLRVQSRRALMESAGRKEIWMMVPLVFLILPTTILFAVWPGVITLNAGF